VDLPDPGGNRPVQRRQIVEDVIAQRREDPAFAMQHTMLDETLIDCLQMLAVALDRMTVGALA
ncbi:MAG: hypothetical protein OXC08_01555, partial [Thiotrichales bacterium]|nr:hypothetical protein [Thiotrichales bacterium]